MLYIIVIGGDFNTDISRHNSCHTIALKQFIDDECLQLCLSTGVSTVDYTFIGALGTRSLIDHFIVTVGLAECVSCYRPISQTVFMLSIAINRAEHVCATVIIKHNYMLMCNHKIVINIMLCLLNSTGHI